MAEKRHNPDDPHDRDELRDGDAAQPDRPAHPTPDDTGEDELLFQFDDGGDSSVAYELDLEDLELDAGATGRTPRDGSTSSGATQRADGERNTSQADGADDDRPDAQHNDDGDDDDLFVAEIDDEEEADSGNAESNANDVSDDDRSGAAAGETRRPARPATPGAGAAAAASRPDRPQAAAASDPAEPSGRPDSPGQASRIGASWRDHGSRPAAPRPIEGTGDIGRGRGRVSPGQPDQPGSRTTPVAPKPGATSAGGKTSGTQAATHATPDDDDRGAASRSKAGPGSSSTSTAAIRDEARQRRDDKGKATAGTGFAGAGTHAGDNARRELKRDSPRKIDNPRKIDRPRTADSTRPASRSAAAGAGIAGAGVAGRAVSGAAGAGKAASTGRRIGEQPRPARQAEHADDAAQAPIVARPARSPVSPASPEYVARSSYRTRDPNMVPALIAAIILSVLLHGAVVMAVFNRPIGKIDPNSLTQPHTINLVRRADQDIFTTDAQGPGQGQQVAEDEQPQLDDLSRQLLEQPIAEAEFPQDTPEPDFESQLRNVQDQRAELDDMARETDEPFDLPGEVLSSLMVGPPVNLPETPAAGSAPDGGSGAIAGDGTADLASRMLAQLGTGGGSGAGAGAGGTGTGGTGGGGVTRGGGIRMPDLPTPQLDQPGAAVSDQRLVDAHAVLPELDLLDTALASTTQLTVPLNLDNDFDYAVHTFWGGDRPDGPPGYFRVDITPRQSLRKLRTIPKDVVIIIDTSGSVSQRWMNEIVQGVSDGLSSLNEGDRFNIVLFNDRPSFFNPEGLATFDAQSLTQAQQFLRGARPRGYTDVNAALSRLLVRDVSANRVHNLILISDGVPTKGVMDTRELINLITRDNNLVASIYCVGVGDRQNRQLLEFLAYRNKGFCQFVNNRAEAAPDLRNLFSRIRYPIVQNISLSLAGVEADSVYPRHLPNIHQGERLSIYGRFRQADEFTMRLTGANGAQPVDFTFTRDLGEAQQAGPQIARDWAFWKLHHLYSEIIRRGETQQLLQAIREIRQVYNLETLY